MKEIRSTLILRIKRTNACDIFGDELGKRVKQKDSIKATDSTLLELLSYDNTQSPPIYALMFKLIYSEEPERRAERMFRNVILMKVMFHQLHSLSSHSNGGTSRH